MSFGCEICGKAQPVGTKPVKVTLKEKMIILPPFQKIQKKNFDGEELVVVVSRGRREVIKEANACPACASRASVPEIVIVDYGNNPSYNDQEEEIPPGFFIYCTQSLFFPDLPFQSSLSIRIFSEKLPPGYFPLY